MSLQRKHETHNPKPGGRARREADPFEALTDEEVDARIRAATGQLRKLGAFEDTSSVPMRHLSDEQLDKRIRQVETELKKLRKGGASAGVSPADLSRAEAEAVVHQLEVLDYLIEHPDASIPPTSALDALDDEPGRWARALLSDNEDVRED